MLGVASSATSVLVGYLASVTKTIRVGSGGIMLPNHVPLMVAEQFGTLATIYGDRIDLGVGRAPGTDMQTARALRRNRHSDDNFPQDVVELIHYLSDMPETEPVRAIPGIGTKVPVWILGSSLYGAQLAAYLGLPYAFASHFAPQLLEEALSEYRRTFRPSEHLAKPYAAMAINACVADTEEEAQFRWTSQLQSFANIVTNRRGRMPEPVRDISEHIAPHVLAQAQQMLSCSVVGSVGSANAAFDQLLETFQPDEVIITGMIHDHEARIKSYQLVSEILGEKCG